MKRYIDRIKWVYLISETQTVRFWFGFFGLFMAFDIIVSATQPEYPRIVLLLPSSAWSLLFTVHACALWYGVITRKFNQLLLLLEGVLGTALWVSYAIIMILYQGGPDDTTAGALIAFWLLVRYPTHWEYTDGK
jgi:hypothetical protein